MTSLPKHRDRRTGAASLARACLLLVLAAGLSVFLLGCGETTVTKYTLEITTQGSGTALPASGNQYDAGTVVALTATPSSGWALGSWQGTNGSQVADSKIVMDGNKSIKAVFEQLTYPLTVTVVGGGTVHQALVAPKGVSYASGSTVQLTPIPSDGWKFDHWAGADSASIADSQIVVDKAKTVIAVFVANVPLTIPRVAGMTIDAQLDDWSAAGVEPIHVEGDLYATSMDPMYSGTNTVTGSSFDFYASHDGHNIFVLYDVTTPVVSFWQDLGNAWNETGTEIFFGTLQFAMALDENGNPGFGIRPDAGGQDIQVAMTSKGFVLECSFDMDVMNDPGLYAWQIGTTLAPGASFPFSFALDITDADGNTRTGQLAYPHGYAWGTPSTFAIATLAN
jgi:hypothetical protein